MKESQTIHLSIAVNITSMSTGTWCHVFLWTGWNILEKPVSIHPEGGHCMLPYNTGTSLSNYIVADTTRL